MGRDAFRDEKGSVLEFPFQNIDSASRLCFYNVPYTVPYTFSKRPLHVPYVPYKLPAFSNISAGGGHADLRAKVN